MIDRCEELSKKGQQTWKSIHLVEWEEAMRREKLERTKWRQSQYLYLE